MAMETQRRWTLAALALSITWWLPGCGSSDSAPTASISPPSEKSGAHPAPSPQDAPGRGAAKEEEADKPAQELHPIVELHTTLGTIKLKLDAEKAPQTVENFLANYVERDFYDKTIFHYVEKGYIVAAGGFTSDGAPKPARAAIRNEAHNGLKNLRGTVAMIRHPDHIHSATSQFFVNLVDNPDLDHQSVEDGQYGYCVFGEVVEGMDVIDRLAEMPVEDDETFPNRPVETVMIESVQRLR